MAMDRARDLGREFRSTALSQTLTRAERLLEVCRTSVERTQMRIEESLLALRICRETQAVSEVMKGEATSQRQSRANRRNV
jgi:hypothetical protein